MTNLKLAHIAALPAISSIEIAAVTVVVAIVAALQYKRVYSKARNRSKIDKRGKQ